MHQNTQVMEMYSIRLRNDIDKGKHSKQEDPLNIYVSTSTPVWLDVVYQSFWEVLNLETHTL